MNSIPIGLSGSDFVAARGHVEPRVHERVDYLEFGGHFAAGSDPGVHEFLRRNPQKYLGRHLVSTELPADVDIDREAEFITKDIADSPVRYLVTDFCFWRLGGRALDNLWFRPLNLTEEAALRIADNAHKIEQRIGIPFYLENPPFVWVADGMDLARFLRTLADRGAKLCLDVGHFVGWCFNRRVPMHEQERALPVEAIRMCHIAGLSHVSYAHQELLIDNHNIPPSSDLIGVLMGILDAGAPVERITYECELAPTDVQTAGLRKLGR